MGKTEKETHVVKKLMIPLQTKQTETKKVNHVNTQIKTHHENNKIASTTTKKETHVVKKLIKKLSHVNTQIKTHHVNNKIASTKTEKDTNVVKKVIKKLSHKNEIHKLKLIM